MRKQVLLPSLWRATIAGLAAGIVVFVTGLIVLKDSATVVTSKLEAVKIIGTPSAILGLIIFSFVLWENMYFRSKYGTCERNNIVEL